MTPAHTFPSLTVNEILLRYPSAVTVMNAHGIDSCCGGAITLEAVAREHELDLDAITADLETLAAAEAR
jgi:regulator of cell morphogenesis and NO signaling